MSNQKRQIIAALLALVMLVSVTSCIKIVICERCIPSIEWTWWPPFFRFKWDDLVIKIDPLVAQADSAAGYYAIRIPDTWVADSCTFIRRDVPTPFVPEEWPDSAATWIGDTLRMAYDPVLTAEVTTLYDTTGTGMKWFAFKSGYVDTSTWHESMPDTAVGKVTVFITTDTTAKEGEIYYVDCLAGDTYNGWADSADGGHWHYPIVVGEDQDFSAVKLASFTATGHDHYVEVEWTTETEIDNAGFNLYHSTSKDAPNAQLNEALIPAQGDELQGATYSFIDEAVTSGVTYYYWLEDVDLYGNSTFHGPVSATPTSVEEKEEAPIPTDYSLAQNYPNPFNATTAISYQLSGVSPHRTTLKVYNIAGQEIATLVDEEQAPGYYSVSWDGRDGLGKEVSSGIYFYRLQAGSYTEIKKMVLLK